jgi:hypothetical protein
MLSFLESNCGLIPRFYRETWEKMSPLQKGKNRKTLEAFKAEFASNIVF